MDKKRMNAAAYKERPGGGSDDWSEIIHETGASDCPAPSCPDAAATGAKARERLLSE